MEDARKWIKEFLEQMAGPSIELNQIDAAMRLKHKNLPKSIFKYRAINDYSLQNLKSDTVWLCPPSEYNDPYDCAITFSTEKIQSFKIIENLDETLSKSGLNKTLTEEQIESLRASTDPMMDMIPMVFQKEKNLPPEKHGQFKDFIKGFLDKNNREMIQKFNKGLQERMVVCSFSETNESIVMWGHYSANHTGFCVEYDLTKMAPDDMRLRVLFPVVYSQELFDASKYFQQASTGKGFNNLFNIAAAMHKAPEWQYEKEWRFIHPFEKTLVNVNYPMPTPSAVYVGSRISPDNKEKIKSIALAKKIPVYQMHLSEREFKLVSENQE